MKVILLEKVAKGKRLAIIAADDNSAGFIYDSTSSTLNALNAKMEFNGI